MSYSLAISLFLMISSLNHEPLLVHDFHLSKTDIHFKSDQQALQVTVHAFIDDMELALRTYGESELKLLQNSEHESADSLIGTYLVENIHLRINGHEQDLYYLGKEASDDIEGVYCYLELAPLSQINELEVSLTLLTEVFDDQKNIISVKADNKSKGFQVFTLEKTNRTFSF